VTGPLAALKAAALLLAAALFQVSIASAIEVADAHPDIILVLVVVIAMLQGPAFGAVAGFWAGLVLDIITFGTLGLTSLLLTLAGYFSGRIGDVTSRSSAYPPLIAVVLATLGVGFGSAVVHFMLGSTVSASVFFVAVLLPTLALNMLLAYPLYWLCRRFLGRQEPRREVRAAV
jgi:rod shape-determining protein MreD